MPPFIDSLLGWVLAIKNHSFAERWMKLVDIPELPIPFEKEYFDDQWFYKCSNPFYQIEHEWIEHWSKRFDVERLITQCKKEYKSVLVSSGSYKMRYSPIFCKRIKFIKWFCVGDKYKIETILSDISAIGNKRNIGYGFIQSWKVNEIDGDYSISYDTNTGKILTKTVPTEYYKKIKEWTIQEIRKIYGSYKMPYWHPENYTEIIEPC
jgi:CRISPR type IV-associated protein Csf3